VNVRVQIGDITKAGETILGEYSQNESEKKPK
jgi:hypothetical protein